MASMNPSGGGFSSSSLVKPLAIQPITYVAAEKSSVQTINTTSAPRILIRMGAITTIPAICASIRLSTISELAAGSCSRRTSVGTVAASAGVKNWPTVDEAAASR
jgi:hypothetical protein